MEEKRILAPHIFFYFLVIKVSYKETQYQNHWKEMFKSI